MFLRETGSRKRFRKNRDSVDQLEARFPGLKSEKLRSVDQLLTNPKTKGGGVEIGNPQPC
jgi:hypothetical protein